MGYKKFRSIMLRKKLIPSILFFNFLKTESLEQILQHTTNINLIAMENYLMLLSMIV